MAKSEIPVPYIWQQAALSQVSAYHLPTVISYLLNRSHTKKPNLNEKCLWEWRIYFSSKSILQYLSKGNN